uniref:Uncharacterized protein n=1 Tax=Arundo donax TaxID=35708 RepID=A0A0A9BS48_ARUDO
MIVDLPQPLLPTKPTLVPAFTSKLKSCRIRHSDLVGYAKSTFLNSILPCIFFWSSFSTCEFCGEIDFLSSTSNTEATAFAPFARSDVMLPASAISFPVLTRTKKVLKTSPAEISPDCASFPPYQKSSAHDKNERQGDNPVVSPATHDFFLAFFNGSSCACSNS